MKKYIAAVTVSVLSAAILIGSAERYTALALTDGGMTETAIVQSALAGAPTVVARLTEEKQLHSLSGNVPSNLIMEMNEEGYILDKNGNEIGALTDIYADYVAGIMIPVIEIEGDSEADKLIALWNDEWSVTDMAVMSADADALYKVRTAIPDIRGIYDCTGILFTDDASMYAQVKTANISMANVVVLSESQSTPEAVNYFQYRFKTVWTQLSKEHEGDKFAVQNVVSSGTYGIISEDYKTVYSAYKDYPKKSIARTSANIAHRGLPYAMAENSTAGGLAAVEAGATHVEIDVHLTKDNVPVIMHDGTIDRTTNGTGTIANMTFEEIRKYSIVKTLGNATVDPEPIPTVEEIFEAFKGNGAVIILEIKTDNPNLFPALKPIIEKYDFWDQLVFISFSLNMLEEAHKQLPQVPTASLDGFPSRDFEANVPKINAINTVVDSTLSDMTETDYYDSMLKDRGYMSYFWTYSTAQDCVAAMSKGVYGITNNAAAGFGERTVKVYGKDGQSIAKEQLVYDASVKLVTETYSGEKTESDGNVFNYRDCGTYAEVIAYYTEAEDILFTTAFRVDYTENSSGGSSNENSGGDNGNGGGNSKTGLIIGCAVGGAIVLAAAGAVVYLLVIKKKQS